MRSESDKIRIRMLVGMGALVGALLVISVAGGVVILADITEAAASLLVLSACLIGVAIVPGGGLLILCCFHAGRIARMPADDPNKPHEGIRQPPAIEEGAGYLNSEMEEQIKIRTAQLARTNELLQAEVTDHMRAREKLEETMDQLKRFNDLAVGRELRMAELKAEVNELCCQLDLEPRYLEPGRNESCHEPGTDRQSCTESAAESEI